MYLLADAKNITIQRSYSYQACTDMHHDVEYNSPRRSEATHFGRYFSWLLTSDIKLNNAYINDESSVQKQN